MGSIPHLSVLKGPSRSLKSAYLHKLFEDVAKDKPNNTALIYEESTSTIKHTYQELNEHTNRIARFIAKTVQEKSLPRNNDGDMIVAVCMPPSDKLVSVLLGIWKSGAAYLPLDPTFPSARIEHILTEARPVMVIFGEDNGSFNLVHKVSMQDLECQSNKLQGSNLRDEERMKSLKDDLAIVLYTSGSTGVPKGVRLPHKVILNRLQWQFRTFPYSKTEQVCVFKTALTFVDSVSEIWGPLINGLCILVVPKSTTKDPEKLIATLDKYKIERLVLVPTLLRSMLMYVKMKNNHNTLKNLKIWVCSGETLSVSLAAEFFKYFPENEYSLCNFYGSTEIMGDVTYHIIKNLSDLQKFDKVPIGVPTDNTILYLLDKDCRPVKSGSIGELYVSGLNLAAGYVNGRDPEKFIENPLAIDPMFSKLFRTGDFAKIEHGCLTFEGRTDSQVKIRGHRVDLSEVDKAVGEVAGIDKSIVLVYKPGEMNQALLAFVTCNAQISESQIEATLQHKLTSYMVPQVIIVESIPLLVNGKIDRQLLLKNYENNNDDSSYHGEIDYTGVGKDKMKEAAVLFQTVASVLGNAARSSINVNANFYQIGGNSLNSIFTISQLKEKGYHIGISDFIGAIDFGEILERMVKNSQQIHINTEPPIYKAHKLADEYREDVLDMVTTSFYEKADLEQWMKPEVNEAAYTELMDAIWVPLIEKDLSFVVSSVDTGKLVGVGFNFDAHDEPEVTITSKLELVFEFLEMLEGPIRDNRLPTGKGKVLHSFMMATHSSLSPRENVAIMKFMEDNVLALAKERKFVGILTTNTSPLTQQLGTNIFGYETMLDYQVNQFVASNNTKPFGEAPDEQRALVHWKKI